MSRIVQVANFVAPHSGGIRTVLDRLAHGYAAAGHEVVQIVPAEQARCEIQPWGRRLELHGVPVPGTGYRVLSVPQVTRVLGRYRPDALEVHDRATLRGLGRWARRHNVPSCVISHERLDRLLAQWSAGHGPTTRLADIGNARLAASFDTVVCTTAWAAAEFERIGIGDLYRVPLGVDLETFHPSAADADVRARLAAPDDILLVLCSRLSPEKMPTLAVLTLAELVRRGLPARLAVAGDGPLRSRLASSASGLPVHLLGHLAGRAEVAALLAGADIALAPGPVETFGLAAVEAMACGTPVVANAQSALHEVIGDGAGRIAPATPARFADAVESLLAVDPECRRAVARSRAETFDWSRTVAGFLTAHGLGTRQVAAA